MQSICKSFHGATEFNTRNSARSDLSTRSKAEIAGLEVAIRQNNFPRVTLHQLEDNFKILLREALQLKLYCLIGLERPATR